MTDPNMTDPNMTDLNLQGTLCVSAGGKNFQLVADGKRFSLFFQDADALRTCYKGGSGCASLLSHLLSFRFSLEIFLGKELIARAGEGAHPNLLGRCLGMPDVEIIAGAATQALWG